MPGVDGYEILNMTLKRIQDRAGYVLVVARGDGKVLLLGTDNARNRLIAINGASPLEHEVWAFRTDYFREIAAQLRARFDLYSDDAFGLWFHTDPRVLLDAIEEFDLATGRRVRMGELLRVDGRVTVKDFGAGVIRSIDARGAVVKLDNPRGGLSQVIAPRSLLKPHVRIAP